MGKTKKLLDGFQTNWWPRFIDTPTRPVNTCLGCIAFYAQARDGGGFWGGRGGGGGGGGARGRCWCGSQATHFLQIPFTYNWIIEAF
jgi:hypothetical protein